MTNQEIEPPNDSDVSDFPPALIHADETVREALAEKMIKTERASTRQWLLPSLGAALLLIGAAGLAYKVINNYQHASPDAFFSVEDQNKHSAASIASRSTEPPRSSVEVTSAPASVAAAPSTSPKITAPPTEPKSNFESAPSDATETNSVLQDDSACAEIKTEQHEIEGARSKPHSSEQGHYMEHRLRELLEQSSKLQCEGNPEH